MGDGWQKVSDHSQGEENGIKLKLDVLMWSHPFQYTNTRYILVCAYI